MPLNIVFVLIIIGGWFSGKIARVLRLPGILGMTLWGVGLAFFFSSSFPESVWELSPFLRSLALIILLLRAGLGIEKAVLQKVGAAALRMAVIPCLFEGISVLLIAKYFLSFSWAEASMLGFILAAVSPAVVVPSMLTLKEKGYSQTNETPTLVLAGATLDAVVAITLFTLFFNMYQGEHVGLARAIASVPYAILIGIAVGISSGYVIAWVFKTFYHAIRATEKVILLLGFSVFLIQIGTYVHIAALLAVMTMGFIVLEKAEPVAHELGLKLAKIWVFAEIFLFVLVGMSVDVANALDVGLTGLAVVATGLFSRSLGVLSALWGTRYTFKERVFCVIAYIPKATVQAALGALPLLAGVTNGQTILSIAVVSICVTAPIGLIGIRYFAPRLLAIELPQA